MDTVLALWEKLMASKKTLGGYRIFVTLTLLFLIAAVLMGKYAGPKYLEDKVAASAAVTEVDRKADVLAAALKVQTQTLVDHEQRLALREQADKRTDEMQSKIFSVVSEIRTVVQDAAQKQAGTAATVEGLSKRVDRLEDRVNANK